MLVDPNLNSPANIDAAVNMKNDYEGWKKKAPSALFSKTFFDAFRCVLIILVPWRSVSSEFSKCTGAQAHAPECGGMT